MGQRFVIDAAIFSNLIHSKVPNRMLPKGLDVPATFNSREALDILIDAGDTKYENYLNNINKMRDYVANLPITTWTQNLYWGWLYTLQPLLSEKPAGYPSFMRNQAWVRKELNTYLGSWTELKHDTILYAKQAYAEMGGLMPEEFDDRGYVEPNPELYARLASLTNMTIRGLEARGLLTDDMKENLEIMEELALSLKTISEKELNNQALSDDEYELIRSYGGQLEHLWYQANRQAMEEAGGNIIETLTDNPAALVADVATDPNGTVLEEATGYIFDIYVIVPIDGKLRITKGGVYSYYEFAWPLSDRLTDSAWRQMLYNDQAPKLPAWTSLFVK